MANSDVLVRMKADVSNYDANIAKARRTLEGFKQDNLTFGGIMNQSTKSIVAAAAQYASFAAVLSTVAGGFAEAASKGMAMSREAEGVSQAFKRLNQPGLLDNLREATHNTVSDLELMKQAVKFDNFNLSLKEMGTFLAFAQQQAKDTGQDVNYLVDSIVTGLGRKSLPILDNLGLSAEEIRTKMKETGDMTKAVAQIIEERMKSAGDYVETAADRAAQAQVRLDNAMKDLGDTMNSLTGAGASLWADLKIGAIDLANTAIKPLISMFNTLASYVEGTSVEDIVTRGMTDVTDTVDDNGRLIRKNAINNIPEITVTGNAPKTKKTPKSSSNTTKVELTEMQTLQNKIKELEQEYVKLGDITTEEATKRKTDIQSEITNNEQRINQLKLYQEQAHGKLLGGEVDTQVPIKADFAGIGSIKDSVEQIRAEIAENPIVIPVQTTEKDVKAIAKSASITAQVVGSIGDAFNSIEDPAAKVAGTVAQAIASVALGFAMATVQATTMGPWTWVAFAALGIAEMISMISTIHSQTGYANGGMIQGNSYSGDNMMAMGPGGGLIGLNAGEIVLSKSMQNNLANTLNGNGLQNIAVSGRVKGTDIILSIDRSLQLQGKQLLTWGR